MHRKRVASKLLFVIVANGSRLARTTRLLRGAIFSSGLFFGHVLLNNAGAATADDIIDDAAGKALLKKHCSQCHGVPSANDHKPGDWKHVVVRMQNHRLKRGYRRLSKSEVIQVSQFLEQAAIIEAAQPENKVDNKNE